MSKGSKESSGGTLQVYPPGLKRILTKIELAKSSLQSSTLLFRDNFVFSKERNSQPKSQTPGFLEKDTAQRSRQQEVLILTVPERLPKSSFEFLSQRRRILSHLQQDRHLESVTVIFTLSSAWKEALGKISEVLQTSSIRARFFRLSS
ncbi:hypothetical protein J6590_068233 [Homalodisca vitripennis]|nr:hypothetical protein J6590_068233 [Homalodisca vitripennis]